MSYLVVHDTNRSEALRPQLNVPRNFRRYLRGELRGQGGVDHDVAVGIIVAVHFARTGKRKGFDRDISLVEDVDSVRVRRIGEKGGAERVENASERVVSRA